MPPINATVYWDDNENKGKVDPDPIQIPAANGATVIQWSRGAGVATFGISGLDSAEFTPAGTNGQQSTPFSTTDRNNNATAYDYTVTATHADGRTSSHDPKIENGTT